MLLYIGKIGIYKTKHQRQLLYWKLNAKTFDYHLNDVFPNCL